MSGHPVYLLFLLMYSCVKYNKKWRWLGKCQVTLKEPCQHPQQEWLLDLHCIYSSYSHEDFDFSLFPSFCFVSPNWLKTLRHTEMKLGSWVSKLGYAADVPMTESRVMTSQHSGADIKARWQSIYHVSEFSFHTGKIHCKQCWKLQSARQLRQAPLRTDRQLPNIHVIDILAKKITFFLENFWGGPEYTFGGPGPPMLTPLGASGS